MPDHTVVRAGDLSVSNSWSPGGRLVRPDGELVRSESNPIGPPPDSPQWAALAALAGLIRKPERPLLPIILEMCGNRAGPFQMDALQIARGLMEEVIDSLKTGADAAPMIVDRYSFA